MTRREFVPGVFSAAAAAPRHYRVALIGHTGHGNYGHDWDMAWNGFAQVEVVAVADPVEDGRAKAMQRSRARKGYADYREMLRVEKPDIVAICPRMLDERVPMVTAAAGAGAHILMEKPLARNLAEADQIVEIVERRKLKLLVGHPARPLGVTQAALRLLRAGELGQLQEIRARGKEDKRAGGEDLIVLGTHCFDLMRLFAGDPEWVFASFREKGRDCTPAMEHEGTESIGRIAGDDIGAMFRFTGGVPGYFASKRSDVMDGHRFGVTLYGSKALLYVPLSDVPSAPPYLLRGTTWAGGQWERIDYPPGTALDGRIGSNAVMAADLMRAIETGQDPVCSARDARWTIEMIAGMYQSHYGQSQVRFPLAKRS